MTSTKRKSKARSKTKSKIGFQLPTLKKFRTVANKVSKRVLLDCTVYLWKAAPRKAKIYVAMKLEKAPKKSTKRKATKRKTSKKSKGKRR